MSVQDIASEAIKQGKDEGSDPLLDCLVILTKLNNRPFSHESLRAGLPLVDHQLTPNIFPRAAERAGFYAKVVKRSLKRISSLVLPAILIFNDKSACILQKIYPDQTADVIFPEVEQPVRKSLNDLQKSYGGYAIFLQPVTEFDSRTEDPKKPASKASKSSWFWGTFWRYRSIYTEVLIASLLINIFTLVSPLFIMNVYDRVVPNNAEITLWVLSIGVMVIYLFDFSFRLLRAYFIDLCAKRADVLMASTLFQRVLGMQLQHKPVSVGGFVNNLREFDMVRDFFTSATLVSVIDLPFIFLFLALIWFIGGDIVWAPLIAIPVVFIWAYFLEKPLHESVKKAMQGSTQKYAILVESVTGLETLKCLRAEGQVQHKWEQFTANTATYGLRSRFFSNLVTNFTYYIQQFVAVTVIIIGVYLIHANKLTLGGLIACNILASRTLAPLTSMASLSTRFQQAKEALQALNNIVDLPQERPLTTQFIHRPDLKGNVQFQDVIFQYPLQKNLALKGISFKIQAGERVAFVGRVGSGKSTIQKLLLALHAPQKGTILLDDVDIRQIDPTDLRRNIGYVPQEFLLFYGNVRENIAMSLPWATDEAIIAAAKLAGVDSFVSHHPLGYGLIVGERGEGLSGGQRQAIAMARAVLTDPPILILDEPTSAMDPTTEQELLGRLKDYLKNKTLLLVTHRPSLLTLVDRIIVVDDGRIVLDDKKEKVLATLANLTKQQAKPA